MFRLNTIGLGLVCLSVATALSASSTLASLSSEKMGSDLQIRLHGVKSELKSAKSLKAKIAIVGNFRAYVAHELEKQNSVTAPDATDDNVALTLIGFDEDLGSFMDDPSRDFSEEKCAGFRVALIHSYSGSGTREPANLPTHTEDSLGLLDLLCKR
jgi:hypothetical protein